MSVVDKNLDTITYAVSLIVKGVIICLATSRQGSRPIRKFLKRALCPILR